MLNKDLFFKIVDFKRLMNFTGFQMLMIKISSRITGDWFIGVLSSI